MTAVAAEFTNEPLLELRRADVRASALAALAALDLQLPLDVPMLIGTELVAGAPFDSVDPSRPDRVVAHAQAASAEHVAAAVSRATEGQRAWSARTAQDRAATLRRAADLLRGRRLELAALAVRECGKPWPEADGDVCEAIDFLEYYAAGALALDQGRPLLQLPGERNTMRYVPRGVTGVIAPWNFPLAIAAGMASAALAVGNAVVLKPAEQAPACAKAVVDALHAAGVPHDALSLLPGGDEAGKALVADPRIHAIAFTGSCAVGLQIIEQAAKVLPGQRHLKKVIAEMGGKNAVIVDSDADLDDVVPALISSAFDYAGQKCSAASRVLVHEAVHDALLERLAGAVEVLAVGQADDLEVDVPAVIERSAQERVLRYQRIAAEQGRIVAQAPAPQGGGWFAPPTVAADLPAGSPVLNE
ncbi:MAG: RHH-type transcriptional regulator, proline utilization regulon repressor / proline dehydrogenase, partial [Baekduia sp.]|nr:RHH-type transcriptional regulator, proline utilization regulon repressor / proline dehydrogenase [Baekduia sp.]